MTAHEQLNVAHFGGSLLLASGVGLQTGSWFWFLLVLIGLLNAAVEVEDGRPEPRP